MKFWELSKPGKSVARGIKKRKIHKYHISTAWYHCWQIYLWDPSICWAYFEKNGVPKITKMTIFDDNLPFLEENSSTLWRFILCCNIWLEFQMPFNTPRMYFAKKKQPGVPKIVNKKHPGNFRTLAVHKSGLRRFKSTSNHKIFSSYLNLNLFIVGL